LANLVFLCSGLVKKFGGYCRLRQMLTNLFGHSKSLTMVPFDSPQVNPVDHSISVICSKLSSICFFEYLTNISSKFDIM